MIEIKKDMIFEHDGSRYKVGIAGGDSIIVVEVASNRTSVFGRTYLQQYLNRGIGAVTTSLIDRDNTPVSVCYVSSQVADPVVESVVSRMRERSEVGIKKYGTTMSENDKDDFLRHLHEELMDAVLYIEKLRARSGGSCPLCASEKKK